MSGELEFTFEELPIIVDLGFEAGLVNGTATIRYHSDGEWSVREIALDGFRSRPMAERQALAINGVPAAPYVTKPVIVDRAAHAWLYLAIHEQLENGRFKILVERAIHDALEADRDEGGERMKTDYEEHNTHNRAQHGV